MRGGPLGTKKSLLLLTGGETSPTEDAAVDVVREDGGVSNDARDASADSGFC